MKFILFHGAFGSPEGNWFPELKEKLKALGQTVITPQFPVDTWDEVTRGGQGLTPSKQNLSNWLGTFKDVYNNLKKGEKLCFVGHSLGPLFILHAVDSLNIQLDSAIFVSPFLDKLNTTWQINHVNSTFYKTDFEFDKLKRLIPISYVLYSDDDPYVETQHSILFAKALDSSLIFVRHAGHMNTEANLNEFPLVFDLCMTRLDLDLYQEYLAHRMKQQVVDYVERGRERVLKLKFAEALDESLFHFRHLKKGGFATFFTRGLEYWDPHSTYMEEARTAARRTKNLIRVIMIDRLVDLETASLKEQISTDLKAGIKIYLCMYDEIKETVQEPDFGIWDDDYVCIVRYGKERGSKSEEIELNSRQGDIQKYQQWKVVILQKSMRVMKPERDIKHFMKIHPH